MKKLSGATLLIASTIIWAAVIVGCAAVLRGTEYKEAVTRILYIGVIIHIQLFNMLLLWTRKEKKTGKPVNYAGITIILSAVIWGGVMIASSMVLKGTEYKEDVMKIIQGASSAHLLFIWAPIGIMGNKVMKKLKKQKEDTAEKESQ
jgi:NADH:ubiquinone oxidoreductase subunit 6 (subunit J)